MYEKHLLSKHVGAGGSVTFRFPLSKDAELEQTFDLSASPLSWLHLEYS
jgi:hypothetical protein